MAIQLYIFITANLRAILLNIRQISAVFDTREVTQSKKQDE